MKTPFKEEAFGFQLELIGELTILLKTNKVDLVTLNDSHLLLNIMSYVTNNFEIRQACKSQV